MCSALLCLHLIKVLWIISVVEIVCLKIVEIVRKFLC